MAAFWAWATVHWWLTFVLAWVAIVMVAKVLTHFFGIFHRPPQVFRLTDAQFRTLRQDLGARVETQVSTDKPEDIELQNASRGRPWHERLE